MIALQLSIEDLVGPRLKRFGEEKNRSRILNFILARVGRRYRSFLRKSYLAGQVINGGSGEGSRSARIMVYKAKGKKNVYLIGEKGKKTENATNVHLANIYEHAGGYTIRPKSESGILAIPASGDAYSANSGFGKAFHGDWIFTKKAIHGKARPFMSKSFASFGWPAIITEEATSVINAELSKAGLP